MVVMEGLCNGGNFYLSFISGARSCRSLLWCEFENCLPPSLSSRCKSATVASCSTLQYLRKNLAYTIYGLRRWVRKRSTWGVPINIPVDGVTLGRIMNVILEAIDEHGNISAREYLYEDSDLYKEMLEWGVVKLGKTWGLC